MLLGTYTTLVRRGIFFLGVLFISIISARSPNGMGYRHCGCFPASLFLLLNDSEYIDE